MQRSRPLFQIVQTTDAMTLHTTNRLLYLYLIELEVLVLQERLEERAEGNRAHPNKVIRIVQILIPHLVANSCAEVREDFIQYL